MKALVALILLVQLPIHKAVPAAPPAPLGCDDPESEAAAAFAVNYINDQSHHGFKFALNQIDNIRVVPQVSEELAAEHCVHLGMFGNRQCKGLQGLYPHMGKSAWLC